MNSLRFRYPAVLGSLVLGSLVLVALMAQVGADEGHFDAKMGFKPVQDSLVDVFRQMASSLEHYGSPAPYFRHIVDEHARVEAKYAKHYGRKPASSRPEHITHEYLDQFEKNWEHMSENLGLEKFTKNIGRFINEGIAASDGKGTIIFDILNRHQRLLYQDMTSGEPREVGSKRLVEELLKLLMPGAAWTPEDMADAEEDLSDVEREQYRDLVARSRFTKADFPAMERFYDSPGYEKLSENGKAELSRRVWDGIRAEKDRVRRMHERQDAERAARQIKAEFDQLFGKLDRPIEKQWVLQIVANMVQMTNSEFGAAVTEWAAE